MAQFDVYANSNPETRESIPYLLDVQNDLLEHLAVRVVVPRYLASAIPRPIKHLNPVFQLEGNSLVMVTQEMAGIPTAFLGTSTSSLEHERSHILSALDFLITGF